MRASDNNTRRIINSHMHCLGGAFWRYMDSTSGLHFKHITDVGLSQRLDIRLQVNLGWGLHPSTSGLPKSCYQPALRRVLAIPRKNRFPKGWVPTGCQIPG